jgi:uncharacterized protein YciI/heme-degrading monooxygenase HmoA
MHYLLFYEVGDDYISRRAEFRSGHLERAWKASQRGELVLGGAFANPVDGAVLLFKGDSPKIAENFAKADPYVTSGAVKRWYVREWNTVAGGDAAMPVRPNAEHEAKTDASQSCKSTEPEEGMILRMWRARSTSEKAGEYMQHATKRVFPALLAIEGYRAAYLLRRALDSAVEMVVLTIWDSMEAVRKFAGENPDKAVVEPEARAVLTSFDEFVSHFEVIRASKVALK